MNQHAKFVLQYRPKPKRTTPNVTTVIFSCVAFFVLLIFLAGHNSIPGSKVTRAQLAAAAAAAVPEEGRDIELSAHRVAQVVGGAKVKQQLQQQLAQQGLAVLDPAAAMPSAEAFASLYGHGGGTVVFEPHDDLASCPEGSAFPHTAQAAVVLLAGSSAAALRRSLNGMMLLYSRAGPDVRSAFHLYVGLDSEDAELRQIAESFAVDSMGAVKLDDMKLAPDFFEFYAATQWLLASDPSLYCLSAWNPIGYKQQRVSPRRIVRSDFSPGRGWMLSRQMGLQLLAAWPQGEGVDWQQHVRSSAVRAGRQCLVPEMPRMVPAGPADASEAGHIHDPAASGKQLVSEHHLGLPSHEGLLTTAAASKGMPLALATAAAAAAAAAAPGEEGIVDLEAYTDYGGASSSSSDLLDAGGTAEQQQQTTAQGGDAVLQQMNAEDGAHAAGSEALRAAGWMASDLSGLLGGSYRAYMEAAVLSAQLCDVTAATALKDTTSSCRVLYNSAAYLSTIAHRLAIPVEVQHGGQYCYPLPAAAGATPRQHCQSYMPEMAYSGIISSYNRHGARVYLVGSEYHEALLAAAGPAAAAAGGVRAAVPAAEKQPQEVPVGQVAPQQ
ncbi:hypothetical protein OEZ85_008247 [Tetradesmus obliquus]|uniref:Alpha-1,3-mannosyl-glycoprotein 2-beta-N-acetylglucosaminyltransferase n=1 Tax=Tetradesmus obliquus TaxID=3088 RepID=A0ABY8TIL7_TETOB|nr:hypothetical protein OEZ85_008247 [Tetradesmus obliquus]